MTVEWTEVDPSVLGIAGDLIALYHNNLRDARIGFVFRSEASKTAGKIVAGCAQKVDAKLKPHMLMELDFLIWIAKDIWDAMPELQRKALIDHELCHLRFLGAGNTSIRPHDFEEFTEVIDRWGLWSRPLFGAATAFKKALQIDLGLEFHKRGAVLSVSPNGMPIEAETE